MKFHELCKCFEELENTSSKLEMVDILAATLGKATSDEIGKISFLTISN